MGRKSSLAGDIVDVASMLPWWLDILLASVGYWLLHQYAVDLKNLPQIDVLHPGSGVQTMLWGTLAYYGQYVWIFLWLLGAVVSAFKQMKRQRNLARVAAAPSRDALESMSWRDFEQLVGEAFRQKGYRVEERGGAGPDGGVDLALRQGKDLYLVQCKQWKSWKVGVSIVRELYGVMAAEGAVGGFVVASGAFTEDARRFAEGRSIQLLDSRALLALVGSQRGSMNMPREQIGRSEPRLAPKREGMVDSPAEPSCPQCGAPMQRRTAKRGGHVGQTFWGCSRYPGCKGTRPL